MRVFVETKLFTKLIHSYMDESSYLQLQVSLLLNPEQGAVIRGSGGIRKVRWNIPGGGKSGGVRVIYYLKCKNEEIWFLTICRKSEAQTIPAHTLRKIREEIENG